MQTLLVVAPLAIIALSVGFIGKEGLWHSILIFFNVLASAALATNYFEPTALWLDSKAPTFSYVIDVVALWGLFTAFFVIFRLLTELASRVKVRFHKWVDLPGGMLLSAWTGWILVCFFMMSLHVAPLAKHSFGGAFQEKPDSRMFLSLAPDRKWLAFMHKLSFGAFGRGPSGSDSNSQDHIFDPEGTFILKYATRRGIYETTEELRVRREFGSGIVDDALVPRN
jgi:hypothetical protein